MSFEKLKQEKITIICGVTGSGKTGYALNMAQNDPAIEILNCDIAQCYKGLEIGTGTPTPEEQSICVHRYFSFISLPQNHTSFSHKDLLEKECFQLLRNNKAPVIVGGSHFYLYCLLYSKISGTPTYTFHENDEYRRQRFERLKDNGIDVEGKMMFDPKFKYHFLFKATCPEVKTIRHRIESMLASGWYEEVEKLSVEWRDFILKKKFIGYPKMIEYIENKNFSKEDFIHDTVLRTQQYIKKQKTFLNKLHKECLRNNISWNEI